MTDHTAEAKRLLQGMQDGIANGVKYTAADIQAGALTVIAHTLLAIEAKLP